MNLETITNNSSTDAESFNSLNLNREYNDILYCNNGRVYMTNLENPTQFNAQQYFKYYYEKLAELGPDAAWISININSATKADLDTYTCVTMQDETQNIVDLLDTGANRYLSMLTTDFQSLSNRKMTINGTCGPSEGQIGELRPNKLGLKMGVFFPHLPRPIRRIYPWLGEHNLCSIGWELNLSRFGGTLSHPSGELISIGYNNSVDLPVIVSDPFTCSNVSAQENTFSVLSAVGPVQASVLPCSSLCDDYCRTYCHVNPVLLDFLVENEEREEMFCMNVDGSDCAIGAVNAKTLAAANKSEKAAYKLHCRCHHFYIPGLRKFHCPQCDAGKGAAVPHSKVNNTAFEWAPLKMVQADFSGKVTPQSVRMNNCVIVLICPAVSKIWVIPIMTKDQISDELLLIVPRIRARYSRELNDKVIHFFRSDNEPTLTSAAMDQVLNRLMLARANIVEYNSQELGCCERYMRTLFDAARTSLNGVDKRLWCYVVQSIASTWARIPRRRYSKLPQYNGMSPEQILNNLCPRFNSNSTLEFPRVFGCLVFFKIQINFKSETTRN